MAKEATVWDQLVEIDKRASGSELDASFDKLTGCFRPSTEWWGSLGKEAVTSRRAEFLYRMLGFCRTLCKTHSAEPEFTINMRSTSMLGGVRVDDDGVHHIVLGAGVLDLCSPDEWRDVYAGVAVHEREHSVSSGDALAWVRRNVAGIGRLSEHTLLMKTVLNALDDVRTDEAACDRSPGFSYYVDYSHRVILRGSEKMRLTEDKWNAWSVRSKLLQLVTCTVLSPSTVESWQKEYTVTVGEEVISPYERLVDILRAEPGHLETWEQVHRLSVEIVDMIETLEKMADAESTSDKDGEALLDHSMSEITRDAERDHSKRALEAEARRLSEIDASELSGDLGDAKKIRARKKLSETAHTPESSDDTFACSDVETLLLGSLADGGDLLDGRTSDALSTMIDEKVEFEDAGRVGGIDRTVRIREPKLDKNSSLSIKSVVERDCMKHVQSFRSMFRFRLTHKNRRQTERLEGRLHRRRLATALANPRIFKHDVRKRAKGISLCLLLDESGSMGDTTTAHTSARRALEMAWTMTKALESVPRMDVCVYSHGSYGMHDEHCDIKRLYSSGRRTVDGVYGYRHGRQNYDHIAIERVGREFVASAEYPERLMLVLSDGEPAGYKYCGDAAMDRTKKSVQTLERAGVKMVQIAIDAAHPEKMFTNYVHFESIEKMIPDLGKLLKTLLLGRGMEVY